MLPSPPQLNFRGGVSVSSCVGAERAPDAGLGCGRVVLDLAHNGGADRQCSVVRTSEPS